MRALRSTVAKEISRGRGRRVGLAERGDREVSQMAILSALIDPRVFPTLSEQDIVTLTAVVDGEIARNPEIHKILSERLDSFEIAKKASARKK